MGFLLQVLNMSLQNETIFIDNMALAGLCAIWRNVSTSLDKNQRRSSPCWMSSSFNSTSRPWPGRRGGGIRCLLPQCGISRSCAAPAGVVRWMNHSGAAAGHHENEGWCQREEQLGRFAPTRWPCSLTRHSIVEDQARWDQWRRLAGGTLVPQAGDRGRGKGERICKWAGNECLHVCFYLRVRCDTSICSCILSVI